MVRVISACSLSASRTCIEGMLARAAQCPLAGPAKWTNATEGSESNPSRGCICLAVRESRCRCGIVPARWACSASLRRYHAYPPVFRPFRLPVTAFKSECGPLIGGTAWSCQRWWAWSHHLEELDCVSATALKHLNLEGEHDLPQSHELWYCWVTTQMGIALSLTWDSEHVRQLTKADPTQG